jgi:hypothetical protein
LKLEVLSGAPARGGQTGHTIYWYYQALHPTDLARISEAAAASIAGR